MNGTVPQLLVANKNYLNKERKVAQEQGKMLAQSLKAEFIETSTKDNRLVLDVFRKTLDQIEKVIIRKLS